MSSFRSSAVLLAVVGLFSQLTGFAYRIALSRLVGAETIGLYQLIMPVYSTLMSLTAAGLTVAVSSLAARSEALGDHGSIRQARARALTLFFCLAAPLCCTLVLCSDSISVHLLGDARTQLGLILLAPCVLLTGIENIQKHCFYGIGRVRPPALTEAAEQLLRACAVLGLVRLALPCSREKAVGAIVLGMVVCEVFSAGTLTVLFCRWLRQRSCTQPRAGVSYWRLLSMAAPVAATSLLGTALNSVNAVLIPAKLMEGGADPSAAISAFGVLCGMTLPLLSLPVGLVGAVCLVLTPSLSRSAAGGRPEAGLPLLGKALSAVSAFAAPALTLLSLVSPYLARALFHEPSAGDHALSLAAGTLLCCYQAILGSALNGFGRQGLGAFGAIAGDAVQLAFTFFTVKAWGLAGYAAGFLLSALVGAALNLFFVLRCTRHHPRAARRFLCPLLACVLMFLCARAFLSCCLSGGLSALASCSLACGLGLVVYLAALQAQGLLPGKRARH